MTAEECRKVYEEQLRVRLLGPGYAKEVLAYDDVEHEIIDGSPLNVYTTGILYPVRPGDANTPVNNNGDDGNDIPNDVDEEEIDIDLADDAEEGDNISDELNKSDSVINTRIDVTSDNSDNRIGLITCVPQDVERINIHIHYARYNTVSISEVRVEIMPEECTEWDNLATEYDKITPNPLKCGHLVLDKEKLEIRIDNINEVYNNLSSQDRNVKIDSENIVLYSLNEKVKMLLRRNPVFYRRNPFDYNKNIDLHQDQKLDITDGLCLYVNVFEESGRKYLKMLLRNEIQQIRRAANVNECFFQPSIRVEPINGALDSYADTVAAGFDQEEKIIQQVYGNVICLGKGIGCAVDWADDGSWIKTDFMPIREVKKFSSARTDIGEVCNLYNLSQWGDWSHEEYCEKLNQFALKYQDWYRKNNIIQQPTEAQETILERQGVLASRMLENVDYLRSHEEAWKCFRMANTAMMIQMTIARNDHFKKDRDIAAVPEKDDVLNSLDWFRNRDNVGDQNYYPFQLAFLLINVRSTFEMNHQERTNQVDLIWFPTGGGKTEAYLALTALTIIARRRRPQRNVNGQTYDGNGVAVMMRYTLRMLATQQFERASYLICALEFMRRHDNQTFQLGDEDISIGLWIGGGVTPNHTDIFNGDNRYSNYINNPTGNNPFPIGYCPWCGTKLVGKGFVGYNPDGALQCINQHCGLRLTGSRLLPIYYVDNGGVQDYTIYGKLPTLLFSTVDKPAQLYSQNASRLMGVGTNHECPELIIQDELHLISGPLGSIVGLFEVAVDKMASSKGIRPKIIASTATTRNTDKLIKKLYNREAVVFPAQGLSYDDNFFSRVDNDAVPRHHIGISPSRQSVISEIRIISQMLLARILVVKKYLEENNVDMADVDSVIRCLTSNSKIVQPLDDYWSQVFYYNSLKDLGRTCSRIGQEIIETMRSQSRYMQIPASLNLLISGTDKRVKEFSSRIESTKIREHIDNAGAAAVVNRNTQTNTPHISYDSPDIFLATNMISVGIDINRWNVMMMSGMPRTTSEYIQASSRVGRKHAGLVVNIFSHQRLREVSIFENFASYHDVYYKYVEPLSVTPITFKTIGSNILVNIFRIYRIIDPNISVDNIVADMRSRFGFDDQTKADLTIRMGNLQGSNPAFSVREVDKNAFINFN